MRTLELFIVSVTLCLASACDIVSSGESDERSAADGGWIATASVDEVEIFAAPTATEPTTTIEVDPGYPSAFGVVDPGASTVDDMVEVRLPARPNDSTGWVRVADVELSRTEYRVEIDLSDHELVLFAGTDPLLTATVAVGAPEHPTPTGVFYVLELLRPESPDGAYGPLAFGLSGHSDQLTEYAGGDGRIGIHGTDQPELLGSDVSHGCVRMANDAIVALAELIPLGTPVDIRA